MSAQTPEKVTVRVIGPRETERECLITWVAIPSDPRYRMNARYRMTAVVDGEPQVDVEAFDLFEALRLIRLQLEAKDLLLCCAGARRDVWASGMQRDMGMGLMAYVLTFPRTADRLAQVSIFDQASPDLLATVGEQEQFARSWFDSPPDV